MKSEMLGYTTGYIIIIAVLIVVKLVEIAWIIFIITIIIQFIIKAPKYYKELKLENRLKLLELFNDGIECLSQRRHIEYNQEKEIKKLIKENKIKIRIREGKIKQKEID